MTRLSLLEDQKAVLTASKLELQKKSDDIYTREQQAISDALLPFFTGFSPYTYIEVTRGSVYFKADHPDYSYKKELFSLYLRENYNLDGGKNSKSFTGVDLSYYTTSTKGVDAWELRRLRMLGDLAEIVLKDQDKMLDAVNSAVIPFRAEFEVVYRELHELGIEINGVERMITFLIKEKIEFDLKDEGITFDKGRGIQLKYNYTPTIKSIRLTDPSKSGKKGTVVFNFAHGDHTSREENCNVESIVDQVYWLRESIVQRTLAE